MILGEGDNEFIKSLIHEYDPVKRHEYYERTKKLKGRKKGRNQGDFSKHKFKRPRPLNRSMKALPIKTPQQRQAEFDTKAKAAQTRMAQAQELIRQRNEAAKKQNQIAREKRLKETEKAKQQTEALEAKKFALENKKLDLESTKVDLDAQQADLDFKKKAFEKVRTTPNADPDMIAQAERQLSDASKKLEIRKKKYDLESQKLDQELQKVTAQLKPKETNPNLVAG